MALTAKQEAFAQNIANGQSQAEAYRGAYNASRMKPETVYARASELMADSKVSVRVQELNAELAAKNLWSREKSTRHWLGVLSDDTGEYKGSDKVNAARQLDRTHGFDTIHLDHTTNGESLAPKQIEIVAPNADAKG